MTQTIFIVVSYLSMLAFGYLMARLHDWMYDELPQRREIKRRMNKRVPRAAPLNPPAGGK